MFTRIVLVCSLAGFASCSSTEQKAAPIEPKAEPEYGFTDEVALTTSLDVELTSGPFSIEFVDQYTVPPAAEGVPEVEPLRGLRRILEPFRAWIRDRPILIAARNPR